MQFTPGYAFPWQAREVEGREWVSHPLFLAHSLNPKEERHLPAVYVFVTFPGK